MGNRTFDYSKDVLYFTEQDIRGNQSEILEQCGAGSLEEVNRDELKSLIADRLLNDGVFGIADEIDDPCCEFIKAEFLHGNEDLIAEALRANGTNISLGSEEARELSPVLLEREVIKYELDKVADTAIDNVIKGIQTERPKDNDVIRNRYEFLGIEDIEDDYREAIQSDLQEYIKENIDGLIGEINSYDKDSFNTLIEENVMAGKIDLLEKNSLGVLQSVNEVLGDEYFRDTNYTVADYFENKEVSDYVESSYAMIVALEECAEVIENSEKGIILPALEQKEADIELD